MLSRLSFFGRKSNCTSSKANRKQREQRQRRRQLLLESLEGRMLLTAISTIAGDDKVNLAEYTAVTVSGVGAGANETIKLTLTDSKSPFPTMISTGVTANAAGEWSHTLSLGSLSDGSITVDALSTTGDDQKIIVKDIVPPTVANVGVPAAGAHKIGDDLDFTVNFNEAVYDEPGSPRIEFTLGADTAYANYASGLESSALVFRYTVQENDLDTDGIVVPGQDIDQGGGNLQDGAGNPAVLTLNNVGDTSGVNVDGVRPTVTGVDVPADATYAIDGNLDFTVNFDDNVTVDATGGTPRLELTLDSGTVYADYTGGSGTAALTFQCVVAETNLDTDGIEVSALQANGGTLRDAVGNDAVLTLNVVGDASGVNVDGVRPTVDSVEVSNVLITDSDTGPGKTFTVTVQFSEVMDALVPPVLTFGEDVSATLSNPQGDWPNGNTYTVTYDVADANLAQYDITIGVSGADDAVGNAQEAHTPDPEFVIHTASPVVYVDDDWSTLNLGDPVSAPAHYFGLDAFATIQEAVNAVDAGGAVKVLAGTYSGDVSIAKQLELIGDSSTPPAVSGRIDVANADNVVIESFDVSGNGVYLNHADHAEIVDLSVSGWERGLEVRDSVAGTFTGVDLSDITGAAGDPIALLVNGGSGHQFTDLTISNVTTTGSFSRGVYLGSTSNNVFQNTAIQNVQGGANSIYGIYMVGATGNQFTDTTIDGISGLPGTVANQAWGVLLQVCSDNTFTNYTAQNLSATYQAAGIAQLYEQANDTFENVLVENVSIVGSYASSTLATGIAVQPLPPPSPTSQDHVYRDVVIRNINGLATTFVRGVYLKETTNVQLLNVDVSLAGVANDVQEASAYRLIRTVNTQILASTSGGGAATDATRGVYVDGGTVSIDDMEIYANGTGLFVVNGGQVTLSNSDFDSGSPNQTDIRLEDSAGTMTIMNGNAFAASDYFIDNRSAQPLDLTSQTGGSFGGLDPATNPTDNFRIEDKMYHRVDDASLGLITWVSDNVYVTAPGTQTPGSTDTDSSIQGGIEAASDGDTVNVEAGNFVENVLVDKSVTINGAGPDGSGTVVQVPPLELPEVGVGFTIAADGVTLQNMLVQGDSMTAPDGLATTHGVVFNTSVDGATLYNLAASLNNNGVLVDANGAVTNLELNQVSLNSNGDGFYVAATGTVNGMYVTDSHFDGNLYGFAATADPDSSTNEESFTDLYVEFSTFNHNARKGIYLEKLNYAKFDAITVDQSGTSGDYTDGAGVDINLKFGNYAELAVLNSTISASGTGSPVNGVGLTVKARDIGGADGIYETNPATLTSVEVANNFITGNQTGIRFGEPGQTNAGPTDVYVYENSITGNILAGLDVQSLGEVDACGNWWGDSNGPNTPLNPLMYPTTGDTVLGEAIIAPWLTDGTDYESATNPPDAPGFQPGPLDWFAPSEPSDSDPADDAVDEGASVDTAVGVTATSTDDTPDDSITYRLTDNGGGAFQIDALTGVVTVADSTKLDYETSDTLWITVQATDQAGNSATADFEIAVNNVAPTAANDSGATTENATTSGDVLTNDTDPNGPNGSGTGLTVSQVNGEPADVGTEITLPSGALLTLNADGSYTYDPNGSFDELPAGVPGSDSFTYTASDGTADSNEAAVTITITGENDPPVAVDDDVPSVLQQLGGEIVLDFNGAINLADYRGYNLSSFTLYQGGYGDGDASCVYAYDGGAAYEAFILRAGGGDFDLRSFRARSGWSNHNVAVFAYDDGALVASTTLALTTAHQTFAFGSLWEGVDEVRFDVNVISDYIFMDNVRLGYPIVWAATHEDASLDVDVLDNDYDVDAGDAFAMTDFDATSALGAAISQNADGTLHYDPTAAPTLQQMSPGETLTDTFTYTITDGQGATDSAVVTLVVSGVNDAPVAVDEPTVFSTNEDGSVGSGSVLANDTDVENDPLVVSTFHGGTPTGTWVTFSSGARAYMDFNGNWQYETNAAFDWLQAGETATDYITYRVHDGWEESANEATVTITVTGVNDAPDWDPETAINLPQIDVNDTGNRGMALEEFAVDRIWDPDGTGFGIALTAASGATGLGQWEYSTDDGASWTAMDTVSNSQALHLVADGMTRVRFLPPSPPSSLTGYATLTARAWDTTNTPSVANGTKQAVTDTGTPHPYSGDYVIIRQQVVNSANPNDAPWVAEPLVAQTASEGAGWSFTVPANTFADQDYNDTLTYHASLFEGSPLPGWLTFSGSTRTFSGTPAQADVGVYRLAVIAVDSGGLIASSDFFLIVEAVNDAPVLAAIGTQTVAEQTLLTFVASATDPEAPPETLTFTLDADSLALGMMIDAASGAFTWTPTEADGPGVYPVTVTVTDDGTPALADFETFNITVNEVNVAPVLDVIGDQAVDEGIELTFQATATDADDPANTLTYTLDAASLALGMAIDAASGAFTWTPTEADGPGVYPVTVTVTDDGTPALADFETFNVTVNEVNVAPLLDDVVLQTEQNAMLTITPEEIESLFHDADGDELMTLRIVTLPLHGNLYLNDDLETPIPSGATVAMTDVTLLTYRPHPDYLGPDAFTWNASDGMVDAHTPATVGINVVEDAAAPTVLSVVRQVPPDATTTATSVTFRITFSEDVQNLDEADVVFTGPAGALATASGLVPVSMMGFSVFDLTVNVPLWAHGLLVVDLAPDVTIEDLAGNPLDTETTPEPLEIDYTIDHRTTPVYVDENWAGMPLGDSPVGQPTLIFGYNAFDTFQDALGRVAQSGTINVEVPGSPDDDTFDFWSVPGDPGFHRMGSAEALYDVPETVLVNVFVNGEGGNDTATLIDSTGSVAATLNPGGGTVSGLGYEVTLSNAESITVQAMAGGLDKVSLYDSLGDDRFVGRPTNAYLEGPGYTNYTSGFEEVRVYATAGGLDQAVVFDSAGDDKFVSRPAYAYVEGPGYWTYLAGFDEVSAYATASGADTAILFDTVGDDRFVSQRDYSYMQGSGYLAYAAGFETVSPYATAGGVDKASLFDSPGDDLFVGQPGYAYLEGPGYLSYVAGFDEVTAYATSGGTDKARLFDGAGNDVFVHRPTNAHFSGAGFYNAVQGFDEVKAYAMAGGEDKATLLDSAGNDTFVARPGYGYLQGPGYLGYASGFDTVFAYATAGGTDKTTLYDSANDDRFVSRPGASYLQGPGYLNYASGFADVSMYATAGGTDEALLYDSAGDDDLEGTGDWYELSYDLLDALVPQPTKRSWGQGFDRVLATSDQGGYDTSDVEATDYLFQQIGNWA